MIVGKQFKQFEQCVAFPRSTWQEHPEFVDAYNQAVFKVIEEGGVEELTDQFITLPNAPCKTSSANTDYSSVSFQEVAGLWIILAGSIGIGLLWIILYRLW